MTQHEYVVVLVYSNSHALRLEKLRRDENIPCIMIPVARHIGFDCGAFVAGCQACYNGAHAKTSDTPSLGHIFQALLTVGVWLALSRFKTGLPSIAHSGVVLGARVEVVCNALRQA